MLARIFAYLLPKSRVMVKYLFMIQNVILSTCKVENFNKLPLNIYLTERENGAMVAVLHHVSTIFQGIVDLLQNLN